MDPVVSLGLGLVLVLVGGIIGYFGVRKLPTLHQMITGDPVDIRDLVYHDGPVEIEGTATVDEETATGLFSGTECLAYEYEAQEYRSSGKSSSWQPLDDGGRAVPFLVEDETGTVTVDPTDAELHLSSWQERVKGGHEPPERIRRYIKMSEDVDSQQKSMNLVVTEFNYGNDQRFIERRLDPGESVYVYGTVERAPAGEWGSGRVDAHITSGERNTPLIISDTSERGAIWRVAKWPVLYVAIGLVLLLPGMVLLGSGLVLLL